MLLTLIAVIIAVIYFRRSHRNRIAMRRSGRRV
jgi:hypothetical protein